MKRIDKLLIAAILTMLSTWGVCYAVDTELSGLSGLAQGTMDDLVYVVNDPNGVPASYKIGIEELIAAWTGSTAVTTLGTVVTGTWNASFTDAALTAIDAGTWAGAASIITVGTVTTGTWQGTAIADAYVPNNITIDLAAAVTTNANLTGDVTSVGNAADITESVLEDGGTDEIAVTAGMMNAGTNASATTYWRGDNTWATPAGSGDMTKAVYDVSADGHVDGNDVAYSAAWNADVNAPSMNAVYDKIEGDVILSGEIDTYSEINTIVADAMLTHNGLIDTFSELDAIVSDKALVNKVDGAVWLSVHDFSTATSLAVPSAESADATLTALGQIHIRGDEDRYSMHFGAGGEIAGEATMSGLKKISATFDPGSWYNSSAYVNLGPILAKQYPNGIIIDYWEATCHLDPDVEMDMDLCYAVNSFGFATPTVADVMDTTNGLSSEDTDANINGGAAIPAGVYLYLRFGADPEGTCQMLTTTILYHGEED